MPRPVIPVKRIAGSDMTHLANNRYKAPRANYRTRSDVDTGFTDISPSPLLPEEASGKHVS